jgi:hypothetical protein
MRVVNEMGFNLGSHQAAMPADYCFDYKDYYVSQTIKRLYRRP